MKEARLCELSDFTECRRWQVLPVWVDPRPLHTDALTPSMVCALGWLCARLVSSEWVHPVERKLSFRHVPMASGTVLCNQRTYTPLCHVRSTCSLCTIPWDRKGEGVFLLLPWGGLGDFKSISNPVHPLLRRACWNSLLNPLPEFLSQKVWVGLESPHFYQFPQLCDSTLRTTAILGSTTQIPSLPLELTIWLQASF